MHRHSANKRRPEQAIPASPIRTDSCIDALAVSRLPRAFSFLPASSQSCCVLNRQNCPVGMQVHYTVCSLPEPSATPRCFHDNYPPMSLAARTISRNRATSTPTLQRTGQPPALLLIFRRCGSAALASGNKTCQGSTRCYPLCSADQDTEPGLLAVGYTVSLEQAGRVSLSARLSQFLPVPSKFKLSSFSLQLSHTTATAFPTQQIANPLVYTEKQPNQTEPPQGCGTLHSRSQPLHQPRAF